MAYIPSTRSSRGQGQSPSSDKLSMLANASNHNNGVYAPWARTPVVAHMRRSTCWKFLANSTHFRLQLFGMSFCKTPSAEFVLQWFAWPHSAGSCPGSRYTKVDFSHHRLRGINTMAVYKPSPIARATPTVKRKQKRSKTICSGQRRRQINAR